MLKAFSLLVLVVTMCVINAVSVLRADDSPPELVVELVGAKIQVNLPKLVEGLGKSIKARLVNKSGKNADLMIAKGSCGCLKLSGLEGESLKDGGALDVVFKLVPTSGEFNQKFDITAVLDGTRSDFCIVTFRGSVEPWFSRIAIPIRELNAQSQEIALSATSDGIEIDFALIDCAENWINVTGNRDASAVTILAPNTLEINSSRNAIVTVPFRSAL